MKPIMYKTCFYYDTFNILSIRTNIIVYFPPPGGMGNSTTPLLGRHGRPRRGGSAAVTAPPPVFPRLPASPVRARSGITAGAPPGWPGGSPAQEARPWARPTRAARCPSLCRRLAIARRPTALLGSWSGRRSGPIGSPPPRTAACPPWPEVVWARCGALLLSSQQQGGVTQPPRLGCRRAAGEVVGP